MNWIVVEDVDAIAEQAVDRILSGARKAISKKGVFSLVLAGGSTPGTAYQRLAKQDVDWSQWQFYFGDERCLPAEDLDRNSMMARQNLFRNISIDGSQVHVIPAEKGAETAARIYAREIATVLPFDMVLLGLGEDGHTASLFPGQSHPENQAVVAVHQAPKPPPDRVSLNYPCLQSAGEQLFLVSGKGKAAAVEKWRRAEGIPAACFPGADILIDEAAWHE
jgi:6-phosphogluconolactonase